MNNAETTTPKAEYSRTIAIIAFITVSIAWGTTYAGMKIAVETIPPFFMAGMRFTLAGAIMVLVFRSMGHALPTGRDWVRLSVVGCLLLAGANGLLAWAEQFVPSGFAALMVNTAPIMYVALSAMLGERVPKRAWLGLTIGFVGVFLLVLPRLYRLMRGESELSALDETHFWWAIGALTLGPICWALGSVVATRYPSGTHPLMTAGVQTFVGGLWAFGVAAIKGDFAVPFAPSDRSVHAVVYLIVVGSWLGYVSYMYCVLKLPSQVVATTTYLNVVVASIVGSLLLGEKLTVPIIAGGVVILVGVGITNSARLQKKLTAKVVPDGSDTKNASTPTSV